MPELPHKKENYVVVSGIGCSSRFPYYVDTYGIHGIHGRAAAIASGVKIANPELNVWVATGDGDGLSIGGNHMIHMLRRNLNIKVMLFNNEIYGLTKGQYSPTSRLGQVTKSSPMGVIDNPFDAATVALGAGATFVARTIDVEQKHLQSVLHRAMLHKGTSFVEVLQNCPIFNDGAFDPLTAAEGRLYSQLLLEHGKPLIFGPENARKAIRVNRAMQAEVVAVDQVAESEILVHDETNDAMAFLLASLAWQPTNGRPGAFPVPLGVLRSVARPIYEQRVAEQIESARHARGPGDFDELFASGDTWVVE